MSVTIQDVSLPDITLDTLPRLQQLRELHFHTKPEICLELPRMMTRYLKELDVAEDSPELRAGKMYRYMLENKQAVFPNDNLLVGTTTTKQIGAVLYPDLLGLTIWPELETISRRPKNPFGLTRPEIDALNFDILPYWLDRTIQEVARREYGNPYCQRLMERLIFFLATKAYCISHTVPNYGALVERGLLAVIDDAREREQGLGDDPAVQEPRDFFLAVQNSLSGILAYAANLSREAVRLAAAEADPVRRDELMQMSQVCDRVPAQRPASFREAVNAVWLYKVALHLESTNVALSPGRLDQVLYPFFAQDLERRRESGGEAAARDFLREAVELVGCLWLKICDHVPLVPEASEELFGGSGSNQAVTLGGVDQAGKDAVNDLTYVMLRATELLKIRDPNVNARYFPGVNSPDYLKRLCDVNIHTGATPCFHNDQAVIETLRGQGVSLAHAQDYAAVGCVEPTSIGRTFGHTGCMLMNLPAALELALFQGRHRLTEDDQIGPVTPAPGDMDSFEKFKEALAIQLTWLIDQAVTLNNNFGRVYQERHPFPLLSALMEGCMKQGRDVIRGGATYNSSGAAIIGLAEVVDSLTAIEEFVFQKQTVSFPDLLTAIWRNWEGYELLQAWLKNSPEKFGANSQMAKNNADWLVGLLHRTFQGQENYRGGRYTVGYWTMTNHAGFGALSGALPSGRRQGEPFPSGITPVSGAARDLLACLDFVAHLDHTQIADGHALNLKYTPPTPATAPKFPQTIEGFFQQGGLQVQFNIIDRRILADAQVHPENYRDLFVRVSGYSAYFIDLNPQMQQEIITRAEYNLATGQQVP